MLREIRFYLKHDKQQYRSQSDNRVKIKLIQPGSTDISGFRYTGSIMMMTINPNHSTIGIL